MLSFGNKEMLNSLLIYMQDRAFTISDFHYEMSVAKIIHDNNITSVEHLQTIIMLFVCCVFCLFFDKVSHYRQYRYIATLLILEPY